VLGLAAKHRSDPIRVFTLAFDRADYDESAIAREMAERVGAEFHPIPIRQADLAPSRSSRSAGPCATPATRS
jgi:asparagine synthase (glutamine-hydrolysing)